MAVITDKFVYVHFPKTGGQFVRHAIEQLGIPHYEYGEYHAAPPAIGKEYLGLPFVTTIRHPVTWYQSRWYHRVRLGWLLEHPVDWACASNDFNQFVMNLIDHDERGRCTAFTKLFARTNAYTKTTYVIRNEFLTRDLAIVLRELGCNVDYQIYHGLQRVNVAGQDKLSSYNVAIYRPEVLERLLHHERWVIDRLYDGITSPSALLDQFDDKRYDLSMTCNRGSPLIDRAHR